MEKGTYVSVKVKNKKELHDFFKSQGVKMLGADDLHSTISYSKKEFIRNPNKEEIVVKKDKLKSIDKLGEGGAIVLKYDSEEMQDRFKECIDAGAIYDYDSYIPHITLTYDGKELNLKELKIPNFDIFLHSEIVEPLDLEWKENLSKDGYIEDKGFSDFTSKIDESTGYLEVNGTIARTGVQDYYGFELGEDIIKQYDLDPTKIYGVYRPKEEVLKQESLDTYINKSITDNHPEEFVNSKNENTLGKGSVSTISTYNKDGIDYVKGKLTIKDEKTIKKALAGKVELSPGYTQKLIQEKGEFQGKQYDFKQTDIKINHVALVDKGRCEGNCKITADKNSIINKSKKNNKGKLMAKITVDGVEHELTDCVAKHIGNLNSQIDAFEKKVDKKDEDLKKKDMELEKEKGEKAKMKEDMEEEKKKTSDSTIDALVSEKVELIKTADTLKVEVKTSDSILDMKRAIIAGSSKIDLTDKTPEFIDGVYQSVVDSKITKTKAITDSQSSAFKEFDGKQQGISKFQDMAKEEL